LLSTLVLTTGLLAFQPPPVPLPAFDVASVKHAGSVTDFNPKYSPMFEARTGHFAFNGPLLMVFQAAFSLPPGAYSAPEWMKEARYEIKARAAARTSSNDSWLMVRRLLEERFSLRYHYEDRPLSVYELTTAKGKEGLVAARRGARRNYNYTIGHFRGTATLDDFAQSLGILLDRITLNKTGYDGLYVFNVSWNMDIPGYRTNARTRSQDPSETVTTYLHVAERLGLKLQPGKATVPVLIIDSINRDPTPN
jgi:uncharacterized protein (TIGR03435 family)